MVKLKGTINYHGVPFEAVVMTTLSGDIQSQLELFVEQSRKAAEKTKAIHSV